MTTLVIGDLHLRMGGDPRAASALIGLLRNHPDAPLVFAGDALDLAAEPTHSVANAVRRALTVDPALPGVLAERVARGVLVTCLAGNHDTAISTPEALGAVHDTLGLAAAERRYVAAEPWLLRLAGGAVHVEHGHVFEPDGAPSHPLAPAVRDDVGVALLRRFIVPIDGYFLVHKNAETPLRLLTRVVLRYGVLAPLIIARYIVAAGSIVAASGGRFPLAADRAEGARRLDAFAARSGLDRETLELLLDAHATPTRAHATRTFLRMYLDRVSATGALLGGATLGIAAHATSGATAWTSSPLAIAGLPLATLGALALVASLIVKRNRYYGRAERALAAGAEHVAEVTGARMVVFGHVHVEASGPHYRNTASFAFPDRSERRSYLRVEDDGCVERAWA